jgi:hypothetical protein
MTVILVILFLVWFLAIDNLIIKPMFFTKKSSLTFKEKERGTCIMTPGFEPLGALAQDGGELIHADKGEVKPIRP